MDLHFVHHLLEYHLRGIFEKHFNYTYGLVQLLITILHVLPTVCQANGSSSYQLCMHSCFVFYGFSRFVEEVEVMTFLVLVFCRT